MPFSLKAKTNLAIVLALSILALMGWLSFQEGRRLSDKDRWVSHTRSVLDLSESLRSHFADAGTARRAYTLVNDASQVPVFEAASSSTMKDLAALRQAVQDNPEQTARLTGVTPLLQARLSILESSVELHRRAVNDRQEQEKITEQGAKLSAQVADRLREFENVERDLLQRRIGEAEASDRRATRINEFLGVSVFMFLVVAVGMLNRELSRRSEAEKAVSKQRQLLESILNSCSDVVVVADESGKIILRNPAADYVYHGVVVDALSDDYPRLLGIYRADGITPFAAQDLPLMRTIRGESVDALEMYIRRSEQSEGQYFLAAGRPLLDGNGNRHGGVIFMRNITQRKLDNQRLNAALGESERIGRERNAALHESQRIANEREKLNRLGDLFQSCQSVEEACKVVASLSGSIFESCPGILFLTNSSRNLVESAAKWGDCANTKEVFEPNDCWGLRLGKAYPGGDAIASLPCSHLPEAAGAYHCVPLVAQGETYGVLYVEEKNTGSGNTEIEKAKSGLDHLATAVAERISLAIANLKLREVLRNQSIRDPLTGLFNRRYLQESLTRELHRAARTHRSVSLVMLDLDHFKRFNDTFGHQAGDALLREFGAVLNMRVRAGDLACRYGGEEFALLLSEADAMGAQACVNHISDAVKKLSVQFRGQSLGSVTLSAGIAVFPEHGDNSEDLIHQADAALYRAKKEGRDRVAISEQHVEV